MEVKISKIRILLLRIVYIGTLLIPGFTGLYFLFNPHEIDYYNFIAYAFWFSYGILSILGILKPLKMLPLIFLQILYKFVFVGAFLIHQFRLESPTWIPEQIYYLIFYTTIIVFDIFVVPWKYAFNKFIKKD